MIGDTVRLMRSAGRQVVYDAEHFFDAFRANRGVRAARRCWRRRRPGRRCSACATPTAARMPELVAEAVGGGAEARRGARSASTRTTTAGARRRQRAGGHPRRGRPRAGHDQRRRRAVRQHGPDPAHRQPAAQVQARLPAAGDTLTAPDGGQPLRLRDGEHEPRLRASRTSAAARSPTRAGCTCTRCRRTRAPTSTCRRRRSATRARSWSASCPARATSPPRRARSSTSRTTRRRCARCWRRVQDLENAGYQFEAAEASFELLLRKEIGRYQQFFDLDHYRVVVLKQNGNEPVVRGDGEAARGRRRRAPRRRGRRPGQRAGRGAAQRAEAPLPAIDGVHLTDYKVRVINSKDETAARGARRHRVPAGQAAATARRRSSARSA